MKASGAVYSLLLGMLIFSGCTTTPITGRKQVKLVSDAQMVAQSATSYREVIAEGPLSTDQYKVRQVKQVGARISAAVEQYLKDTNQQYLIAGFEWEFNLIDQDIPNAWCMPGGKVAFYTGILPYCADETGIAVVMGHEIAHAVVGHGAERVSHQMIQQGGGLIASWLGSKTDYQEAIVTAYGLGSQIGAVLPYSRLHESEADHLGLIFMAMAGYNPEAAIGFWQRMEASNPNSPPEFLSTHPSGSSRIQALREHLPEAREYCNP